MEEYEPITYPYKHTKNYFGTNQKVNYYILDIKHNYVRLQANTFTITFLNLAVDSQIKINF